jgi:dTDP-glucose 4,6-dehydratase
MSKKICITGGAGFIGSHTVIEALSRGYEVWNIDILNYASNILHLESIKNHDLYHFIKGDICDMSLLDELFQKESFDYVMHLAAETHVDRSLVNPEIFVQTNVLGTYNILECSRKYNVQKFLHVSTDEVYGDLLLDEPAFTEDFSIKANSPYSASKASSDLFVRSYVQSYGLNACITRCSNNYGPHQDASKLIPLVIAHAYNKKQIPIYGKGDNVRDWLYVKDHVSALFTVLEKGKKGEVYNIGGNNEKTNLQIVQMILKYMNVSEDLMTFVKDRPGHDYRYAINSSKIFKELGWKAHQDFEVFLQETIQYYLNSF